MKYYQKLADIFTPWQRGCRANTAISLLMTPFRFMEDQGFMKDYPVERIYRDARITSIYEGTTQLQVVAAIRGITTGAFLAKIREYEAEKVSPQLEYLKRSLIILTEEFEQAVKKVTSFDDNEFIDFHARRLVEMAGHIIMSYLLLLDSNRDEMFLRSAKNYITFAKAQVKANAEFIRVSELSDIGTYKYEL
jgi:3-(methylthio)propanoyl-CoA dehydrogenase